MTLPSWFQHWLEGRRIARAYRNLYRMVGRLGDRYEWRDDEACLSDECVARVREAEGS